MHHIYFGNFWVIMYIIIIRRSLHGLPQAWKKGGGLQVTLGKG